MTAYLTRRILQLVPVLIGITLVTFLIVRLTGDPATIMLPPDTPREAVEAFRHEYGLDQPAYLQYASFVVSALHGDFGTSIRYREPVGSLFFDRLPATLQLGGAAMLFALALGIPLGIL